MNKTLMSAIIVATFAAGALIGQVIAAEDFNSSRSNVSQQCCGGKGKVTFSCKLNLSVAPTGKMTKADMNAVLDKVIQYAKRDIAG